MKLTAIEPYKSFKLRPRYSLGHLTQATWTPSIVKQSHIVKIRC